MGTKISNKTSQETLRLINNIPFFESFSPTEKQEFAGLSNQVIEYSDKTAIVEEGQTDMAVFILLKGEAIVTRNDLPKVTINTLTLGALFGEVSFLTQTPRTTNIYAKARAKVLKLDQKMFEKLKPETREKLKDNFITVLVNRMCDMNTALVRLKVEMEAISQAAVDYQGEFDRILKSGKTMKEVFGSIHSTIDGLIR
ncbi:MAG: cyclic nucleotide-binding domain-containing protein [Nitrospina sp.]|jgi:CRP/FNR family transcriptional regulator, cyclic AMP receptor protein|nr:cyclic nucleotide-binding domain-containing protein [Nitrospina sp.]MBT3875960.1 cyclic nucleotide-binding domain-containing protein [Nitrospina sp.]MBT4048997.1 cyclic nucleotide-binding domain-containing protein [Nitrospina sp.]MBT4557675.1 cyclic nucleotide-binding domain-containing protein [Nitrospina sp.]MBT5347892.1 cyclic nucleotide-binding domain-containing protein [Nitrospina sp.]